MTEEMINDLFTVMAAMIEESEAKSSSDGGLNESIRAMHLKADFRANWATPIQDPDND